MNAGTRRGSWPAAGLVRLVAIASLFLPTAAWGAATDATPGPTWPPELGVAEPDPVELVAAARNYLAEGRLGPAIELLGYAAALRPDDADAHWLLASTLTVVRLDHPDDICTWGAWPDVVFEHVAAAVAADPTRLATLVSDPQAAGLREVLDNSLGLRALLEPRLVGRPEAHGAVMVDGRPVVTVRSGVRRRKNRVALLVDTRWYALDASGASDSFEVDLRADGSAVWGIVHRDADEAKSAEHLTGRWAERRGFVSLMRDDGVVENVWITLDGLIAAEGTVRFTDNPVDCTRPFDVWAGFEAR